MQATIAVDAIDETLLHMPSTGTDTSLSTLDPIRLLAKSFKAILLAGVVGTVVGLLLSHFIQPRWIAKMTIQLGQVSTPDAKGSLVAQPLENQLTVTERCNLPSLRLNVLRALGLPAPGTGNKDSDLIFQTLKTTAGRSPSVVNIEVSAYSRESATSALEGSVHTLFAEHRRLFDQTVSDMRGNLAIAESKLAAAQSDYARTSAALRSTATSASTSTNSAHDILVSNTATVINSQILELQQRVASYRDGLAPLRTYPTEAMGPAYVPKAASTPGTLEFIAAGAVVGLIFGAGLVFLRELLRAG